LVLGRNVVSRIEQRRVKFEIVGDGIETVGGAELLNGVKEHPIETHL
jgi:hypothetical protein